MTRKKVDFHKLGNELWSIANIFRDDTLKTTEYLEEFSYFLFLKLFDDQEKQKEEAAKLDGKKYIPYLPEELRFYTWANKIINGEIPINEVVHTVKKIFQELANIKDHDGKDLSLFRRLFRNHIWRIKYGPTIRDLLKRLVDLELEQNFDVMGRAYEFVVQKLGEQKQYGQYFTPRHIIHFMVELADPEIGEKIYDPAAGTGGFILRAFEVVSKKIEEKYKNDYSLAEKAFRELKEKNLWAVEKAPDVYKLALMNMILHNDGKSNLYEADSLDNRAQVEHKQKYDVVLTNPPYGPLTQSRVGVFDYHVKRFEALFIQHIMNALKFSEEGQKPSRAVVIILDKILFDSTRAFKNIRKKLLREYKLKAVFSMPAGIFQPYSGVKTTVLYFERPTREEWNEIKKNNGFATKNILFFEVRSDGFTLSTQRKPINGAFQGDEPNIYEPPCGDLPKAVEVFKEWQKALETGNIEEFKEKYVDNEQVWLADIDEVKEKDFNLNPGLYRKVERGKVKWEWVKIIDVADFIRGTEPGSKSYCSEEEGIRFIRVGDLTETQKEKVYTNSDNIVLVDEKDILMSFDGTPGIVARGLKGAISSGIRKVHSKDESKLLNDFLYYILQSNHVQDIIKENTRGVTILHAGKAIPKITIPLPPLEVQKKIVERLDKQQAIIEKAKEMEKAIIDAGIDDAIFEGDWEWVELGEVILNIRNGIYKPKSFYGVGNAKIIQLSDLYSAEKYIDVKELSEISLSMNELKRYSLNSNDIVINRVSKELDGVGSVALIKREDLNDFPIVVESNMFKVSLNTELILPEFIWIFSKFKTYKEYMIKNCNKGNQVSINQEILKSLKIPLPPLEKQKEIVEFLDVQFQALEKIRKLRENAEKTIKLILEKEVFGDGQGTSQKS